MTGLKLINLYLIIFVAIAVLLKIIGLANYTIAELITYLFILYGIFLFYVSYIKTNEVLIFTSVLLFLSGAVLFVLNNFQIINREAIVFPSVLLILSAACLFVYLFGTGKVYFFISSIILFTAGVVAWVLEGSFNLKLFFRTIPEILSKYWLIILIAAGMIFILSKANPKRRKD